MKSRTTKNCDKIETKQSPTKKRKEKSVQIANPIYDVVFKFLLDDNKIAKKFLSVLTGKNIVTLEYKPTELRNTLEGKSSFTVLHIDFSAVVELEDGSKEHIIIELQKASYFADILRFRRYLAAQYANADNTYTRDGKRKAMPIYTIYFLGHTLDHTDVPVITIDRVMRDKATGKIIDVKEDFVEALSHDSLVIQIPCLKNMRRNEIEKVLSVFDVSKGKTHFFDIDEKQYPKEHQDIIRRLRQACSEKTIRDTMICEDEILAELGYLERTIAQKDEALDKAARDLSKKDEALDEAARELGKKDEALDEAARELGKKDEALDKAAKELSKKDEILNKAVKALAEKLGISEDEACKLL